MKKSTPTLLIIGILIVNAQLCLAGSATSVIDRGLASRTSYSYRVRAYNSTAWSPYSGSVTVTTLR